MNRTNRLIHQLNCEWVVANNRVTELELLIATIEREIPRIEARLQPTSAQLKRDAKLELK